MPHATLKVAPGVDQNETPALNQAGISLCNLIRFIPDRNGLGLVQKLGGWLPYYTGTAPSPKLIPGVIRALWAWEDTNAVSHLAFGTEDNPTTTLGVIDNPVPGTIPVANDYLDITPTSTTVYTNPPQASTTQNSSLVIMTDPTVGSITKYDSVYIATHISVGGLILFGLYPCNPNVLVFAPTEYFIQALQILGNPAYATSTSSTATVAEFTAVVDSISISVLLANHGYSVGSTYPILVATTVGGIYLYGNYIVQSVGDANTFTINGNSPATSSETVSINGGNAYYIYSFGTGVTSTYYGYGSGLYGDSTYGKGPTVIPATGTPIHANDWTMDNWGQVLVSCPTYTPWWSSPFDGTPQFQPIYQWDPTSNSASATIIPNAPPVNDGIFVAMPQRQIIAWGSTQTGVQDPLLIRWCDVGNYDSWIATVVNQAGSYRIPKGSKIVGCIQGPQQGLIWTDIDVWSMQYIGQPYVYSFNEIGTGCGLISKKAAASVNGVIYWMGPSQFFSMTGNGVQPLPCPAWDIIFQDLDTTKLDKIRVAVNSRFGEISWFYPTKTNSGEVNAYVKYNIVLSCWDFGALNRTAWIDQSVLGPPVGASSVTVLPTGPIVTQIYQHETSPNASNYDGTPAPMLSSFQTGWAALSEADIKVFIDEVWPDMKWGYFGGTPTTATSGPLSANVQITFYVSDFPSTAATQASIVGSVSGTVLTVETVYSGELVAGQYISGAAIAPNTQLVTQTGASTWTLSVQQTSVSAATTAASGNATVATLTFAKQNHVPFPVGSIIAVTGVTPNGYNATAVVTAATQNSVSYYNATTGVQTVAGTITAANNISLIASSSPIAVYGPYTVSTATNWFNPRIRGRLMSIGVSSSDYDSFWRIGAIRYRMQQDGKY